MATQQPVAIIIINWNGFEDTRECLLSLLRISYPSYKIFVVDNGSEDDSLKKLRRTFKGNDRIEIAATGENLGFAGGNNFGLKRAAKQKEEPFQYFFLLNNDTTVSESFLEKLVYAAEQNPKLGIIGPKIYFFSDKQRIWFVGGKINWLKNRGEHGYYNIIDDGRFDATPIRPTDFISGCALIIKREVIDKIGLMDDRYFLYYEDLEWNLRAKEAGYDIAVVPKSVIYHKVSRSTKEKSFSYIYYHTRNGALCASIHGSAVSRFFLHIANAYIALKQLIKLLIPSKKMWAKAVLLGIKDFYGGKTGKLNE